MRDPRERQGSGGADDHEGIDMATLTSNATVVINSDDPLPCELDIRQDVEMVRSSLAVKPDVKWSHTDAQGHFHAWSATKENPLPTLRREVVDVPCPGGCDDPDCEGVTETHYYCLICAEEITPRHIPDFDMQNFGTPIYGPKSATITVRTEARLSLSEPVTVRVIAGEKTFFGVATLVSQSGGSDGWVNEFAARSLEPQLA